MAEFQQILFWVFSIAMLTAGALMITRDNLVNSAMLLIQVFLCMAGIFLLLHAFFLAIIQVLVYAGAVVVLFLFVIMLLRPEDAKTSAFSPLANAGAIGTFAALCGVAMYTVSGTPAAPSVASGALAQAEPAAAGLREVVQPVFGQYVLAFELTALILLAAMVGVVVMSKRDAANSLDTPNRLDAIDANNDVTTPLAQERTES
ncbi:MAG TPA: NADH-quinone oxidoreductase subunit J [Polyangiaceae bacterium]|jgi:NADH-quinone oxidoreductase subunit J|nr:NADH-quinone oxidoreductase subunit J [Polyangiaceae bacterium]